jgi:hypothetical protein
MDSWAYQNHISISRPVNLLHTPDQWMWAPHLDHGEGGAPPKPWSAAAPLNPSSDHLMHAALDRQEMNSFLCPQDFRSVQHPALHAHLSCHLSGLRKPGACAHLQPGYTLATCARQPCDWVLYDIIPSHRSDPLWVYRLSSLPSVTPFRTLQPFNYIYIYIYIYLIVWALMWGLWADNS